MVKLKNSGVSGGYTMAKAEIIEFEIDDKLKKQVEDILQPMGLSIEDLINIFFHWSADHPSEAIQFLKTELNREKNTNNDM